MWRACEGRCGNIRRTGGSLKEDAELSGVMRQTREGICDAIAGYVKHQGAAAQLREIWMHQVSV